VIVKITTLQQLSLLGLSTVAVATSLLPAQAQISSNQSVENPGEISTPASSQDSESISTPAPGTVTTSAAGLDFRTAASTPNPVPQASEEVSEDSEVAQGPFGVAEPTRSGPSYIGVGANVGIGGATGLGDTALAINGKIGLTNTLSVRPAAIFGDDTAFLIPVTYDFNIRQRNAFDAPLPIAPYAGGGVIFSTDDDEDIGFLLTGGIDFPLSNSFTANAGVNVGFVEDDTEIGVLLGVGYTFPNF
jgi:hypothetical protein